MSEKFGVYAVKEFNTGLNEITVEDINKFKTDFPNATYACLLICIEDHSNQAQVDESIRNKGAAIQGIISQGNFELVGVKGKPPGSTNVLEPHN